MGDNGDSIGAYQIQQPYFEDAQQFDANLSNFSYEDVTENAVARRVITTYWLRYATKQRIGRSPTLEDLARIHNAGPNGFKRGATDDYWRKISALCKVQMENTKIDSFASLKRTSTTSVAGRTASFGASLVVSAALCLVLFVQHTIFLVNWGNNGV